MGWSLRFTSLPAWASEVSDITYIATGEGWLYCAVIKDLFAVIKDLFTKKVVGYATSERINARLVIDALNIAIYRQKPPRGLIFHSDRGWSQTKSVFAARLCIQGVQYTAKAFRLLLDQKGFLQSMTRKGDPYDNAVAENFFSCLKCECVHLNHFKTRSDAKLAVFSYIEVLYNRIRPHSSIGWMSPMDFERKYINQFNKFEQSKVIESKVA